MKLSSKQEQQIKDLLKKQSIEEVEAATGVSSYHIKRIQKESNAVREQAKAEAKGKQGVSSVKSDNGNTNEVTYLGRERVTTLEQLIAVAKIDLSIWQVESFTVNTWEMGSAKNGSVEAFPLYQVKAVLRRIKLLPVEFEPIAPIEITVKSKPCPVVSTRKIKRAIILPDIQCGFKRDPVYGTLSPLHDRQAIDVALQIITDTQPDTVIWLGDDLDLADWSTKYISSPAFKQSTQAALVELAWMMGKVRAAVPNAVLKKIAGNHDERMEKAIISNMEQAYHLRPVDELESDPALSIPRLLGLDGLDIEYLGPYPQGEFWLNDNFRFHHGEIARGQSGKTAVAVAQDLRSNECQGHIHKTELVAKTLWSREGPKVYMAFSPGTLASIKPGVVPGYKSHQNWQNGIGVVDYEDTSEDSKSNGPFGLSTVTPVIIYDGVALFDGKRYEARAEDEIVDEIIAETGFDVTTGYLKRRKVS